MPISPHARPRDRRCCWSEAACGARSFPVACAGFRPERSSGELARTCERRSCRRICHAGRPACRRRRHHGDREGVGDLWGAIPVLRNWPLVGLLLRANRDAREAYAGMIADPNYVAPQRWDAVDPSAFDALLLPGGHRARGMRDYLESDILQNHVAHFFDEEKPVAAICHGVLLAARSISKGTGRSVLYGYKTTALTWALERSAWSLARVTRFWDPNYYRTYLEQDGQPD